MNVDIDVSAIREKLVELGWTQAELAEAAKLTKRAVEGILKRGTAALESLHKIATALEVDVAGLRRKPDVTTPASVPSPPGRTLFQVPLPEADFTGRAAELDQMAAALTSAGGTALITSARGIGGAG